jgi:phosphoglycerate dehydrogenase-like enzyme
VPPAASFGGWGDGRSGDNFDKPVISVASPVNTSRGPIVDESALIDALRSRSITGAALDVFDTEPLPVRHPFRDLDNVLATPHIGYVADIPYKIFYRDAVAAISRWLGER